VAAPYFRQDQKLVEFVLTQPPDRVSYRSLAPDDAEMKKISDIAVQQGVLTKPVELDKLLDRTFIPKVVKARDLKVDDAK
jgi:NitT/TauT family transport system substrate-binding protein